MTHHLFLSSILVTLLVTIMYSMKKNAKKNFSSNTNIECGFNSLSEKNLKFSNQFFMIAIIFVIFDMELIVIMPLPYIHMNSQNMMILMISMILLIFSLLMEWMNGLIEWTKS